MPVSMQYHAFEQTNVTTLGKGISSEKENRKNHQKTQDKYRQEYQSSESQGLETTGPIIFQTGHYFDGDGTIAPTTRECKQGMDISYKQVSSKRP
jgi:hypothetical protein